MDGADQLALTARITTQTPAGQIYGFEILVGIGTGCFIQAGYAVIQAVTPAAEMAYAISFMMLAQLAGIALGLAIAGAVFVNRAVANLAAVLPPGASREQLQLAVSGTSGAYLRSLSPALRAAATDAIVEALRKVFIPVYVAAAFCLLLSVLFTVSDLSTSLSLARKELARCIVRICLLTNSVDGSNGKCSRISRPSRRKA
jgi:hypothetical protein